MIDYTENGEIVRGSRWPAGDDDVTITITKSTGWPAAAASSWVWKLCLASRRSGGAADLELTASSKTINGTSISLAFSASAAETATLPGSGSKQFDVDLKSTDGAEVSIWDALQGKAKVRDAAGAASS